jgi:hypothetical protein
LQDIAFDYPILIIAPPCELQASKLIQKTKKVLQEIYDIYLGMLFFASSYAISALKERA